MLDHLRNLKYSTLRAASVGPSCAATLGKMSAAGPERKAASASSGFDEAIATRICKAPIEPASGVMGTLNIAL